MQRDPSIHIKRSDLKKVLNDHDILEMLGEENVDKFLNRLFFLTKSLTVSTRAFQVNNRKQDTKLKQIQQSSRIDSTSFERLIYAERIVRRHKGFNRIKSGSKDWPVLKEVTSNALSFCSDFHLDKRLGCIKYIQIGMDLMQIYNITKFKSLHEKISDSYIALQEIEADDDPDSTLELYRAYNKIIIDHTGIVEDLTKLPTVYVWFVRAKQQSREHNVDVNLYVDAQFSGLAFAKGIPHPSQLVGEKANARLSRYLYQNNYRVG